MGEVALIDRIAFSFELFNRFRHVHGIPYDDGVVDLLT